MRAVLSSRASGDASSSSSSDRSEVSPVDEDDVSPRTSDDVCGWCGLGLPTPRRVDAVFCGRKCRQAAFRLRRRRTTDEATGRRMRFAYADPPYPGLARKYYQHEASYAGEVDHRALVEQLEAGGFDGWALSTAARSLREVLPLCPTSVRVCSWTKPNPTSPQTRGLHNRWEALCVVGGRRRRGGVRDWLHAQPARFGGELAGRKPLAFCAWLFDCLGMEAGDELVDLFPGTGVVGRAWEVLSRGGELSSLQDDDVSSSSTSDVSSEVLDDVSSAAADDTSDLSPLEEDDTSSEVLDDRSANHFAVQVKSNRHESEPSALVAAGSPTPTTGTRWPSVAEVSPGASSRRPAASQARRAPEAPHE